jgi:6-phosphogluconolactonase
MSEAKSDRTVIYVGTYTRSRAEGIYVYRMDSASGALELVGVTAGGENPCFLGVHPARTCLYAVNEVREFAGKCSGGVSAFSIDGRTGLLTPLNQQASVGTGPCHLTVDRTGRFVLVANYAGGSVAVLPIGDGGLLGEATGFMQHQGSSVHPKRQAGPHAHSVNMDGANRHALVADLGLDRIVVYRLDPERGKLTPAEEPWADLSPGAGPRHLAFHPNGRHCYVICELDSTITAFAYDAALGALRKLQTVPALPKGFEGVNLTAEVAVSPSGRFLYGSNRGHDSIVVYAIEQDTGRLTYVCHQPTLGRTPRHFAFEPTGEFLLAANQDSDTVVTFRVDRQTGRLTPTGRKAAVPAPVCVRPVAFPS